MEMFFSWLLTFDFFVGSIVLFFIFAFSFACSLFVLSNFVVEMWKFAFVCIMCCFRWRFYSICFRSSIFDFLFFRWIPLRFLLWPMNAYFFIFTAQNALSALLLLLFRLQFTYSSHFAHFFALCWSASILFKNKKYISIFIYQRHSIYAIFLFTYRQPMRYIERNERKYVLINENVICLLTS